ARARTDQKARWSSEHHGTALNLVWADGDGFEVEEKPELDDDAIGEQLLVYVRENAGTGWTKARNAIKGVGNEKLDEIRDVLFASERLLNVVDSEVRFAVESRKPARLYVADDP